MKPKRSKFLPTLQSLFLIRRQKEMRNSNHNPYVYTDGRPLSTRDFIRVGVAMLDETPMLQKGSVTDRLKRLKKKSLIRKLPRNKGSYWGYNSEIVIFENTEKGDNYLDLNFEELRKFYGNKLDSIKAPVKEVIELVSVEPLVII